MNSPCCGYKFPHTPSGLSSPSEPDYFGLEANVVASMAMAISPAFDKGYFDVGHSTLLLPQKPALRPSNLFNLVMLEATCVNQDFLLTDTLVGTPLTKIDEWRNADSQRDSQHDSKSDSGDGFPKALDPRAGRRNVLSLKLRKPLHHASLSATSPRPLYKLDEERAHLAVDSTFNIKPLVRASTETAPFSLGELVKTHQLKKTMSAPVLENMRASITGLSPSITYVPAGEVLSMLQGCLVDPNSHLPSVLVIDIRPFADYIKGHVRGAINVCLPLTLLKRANFTMARCINLLPTYEKTVLRNFVHHHSTTDGYFQMTKPQVFVYDSVNTLPNLYHMCRKLVDLALCRNAQVVLAEQPYADFALDDYIEEGRREPLDVAAMLLQPEEKERPSLVIETGRASVLPLLSDCTPLVSNFRLPQNLPCAQFKIRHNEEQLASGVPFAMQKVSAEDRQRLPEWLRLAKDCTIEQEFSTLEQLERSRLNAALALDDALELHTPGGTVEPRPRINCGLDYGHKNRYRDVFLYDHLRVRLDVGPAGPDGYINALYINPGKVEKFSVADIDLCKLDEMRYIATQGPLRETMGDFWRCAVLHKCLLIVSLSGEFEDGVNKCSPFWKAGVYRSGSSVVKVEIVQEETFDGFVLRSFAVCVDAQAPFRILQVQLELWTDMLTLVAPLAILKIVALKHHIASHVRKVPLYSTITHCSAGCGRTGVFCAVDSLVGLLKANKNNELRLNPVLETVNNLRLQRILMVQTMRQYYLVYDTLTEYVLHSKANLGLTLLPIVSDFVAACNR